MYILLIFVSALAAVLYLLSSLFQLLRGHARAGFWGTFFMFVVVICALIAVYETPTDANARTIALGIAAALIVVDLIFALLETRLQPRVMRTSRALLGIAGGVVIALGVLAFPYRLVALQALGQRTGAATSGQFGQNGLQNAAFTQGQGSTGANTTGSQGAPALTVTKSTEASQALESETGLKVDEVLQRVTGGETIAALVEAHKGDLTKVTTALSNTIKTMVQDAVTAGTMQQAQADRMTGSLDQTVTAAVQGQLPAQMFDRLVGPAITGQPITAGFGGNRGTGAAAGANGTQEASAGGGFGSGRNVGANGTPEASAGGGFGSGRNFGGSGTPEATAEAGTGGGFGSGRNFGSGNNASGTAEPQPPSGGAPAAAPAGGFAGNSGGTGNGGSFNGNAGGFAGQIAAAPTATSTPFPTATALPPRPTEVSPTPTNTPFVIATMTPAGTPAPGATPSAASGSGSTASAADTTSGDAAVASASGVDLTQTCVGFTTHNVNLRSEADAKSDLLMTVTASSQLQIDGRNADSTWLAVTFQGKSGWMDAQYIQLVGKCDAIPEKSS